MPIPIAAGTTADPPTPPSTALLARRLAGLRKGYLLRRGADLFAIALAIDLVLSLLSIAMFLLLSRHLPVDYFTLTLLALLLLRETRRWPQERFAGFLDRRFGLADRFYSFLWYSRAPSVPREVREAQAAECLRNLDFPALSRATRPRIPRLSYLVVPLFAALVALHLNSFPAPPGFLGQTLSRTLLVIAPRSGDTGGSPRQGGSGGTSGPVEQELQFLAGEPARAGTEIAPQARSVPGAPGPGAGGAQLDLANAPGPQGGDASARGEIDHRVPVGKATESFPVSRAVSPPIPRVLTHEPSFDPSRFSGGDRLLELLPGAARMGAATFDTTSLTLLGLDLSRYPVRYRGQMEAYFKELWTWSRK